MPKIREWLNGIETAKLPRTPTSTISLDPTAILAVQRAVEVRSSETFEEMTLRIHPSALFRESSLNPTDVVPDFNGNPPRLGDRIVNVCANGIPFGAKGTVVGIHKAGCVEVVMDKEFIGGGNLQGSCAKFKGKLALWSHLLQISATLAIEDEMKHLNGLIENVKSVDFDASKTSQSPRKQGARREALGPAEREIGFRKGWRDGNQKSGYERWRDHIKQNDASAGFKAVLGVKEEQTESSSVLDTSADLKAMLGISSAPPHNTLLHPNMIAQPLMSQLSVNASTFHPVYPAPHYQKANTHLLNPTAMGITQQVTVHNGPIISREKKNYESSSTIIPSAVVVKTKK